MSWESRVPSWPRPAVIRISSVQRHHPDGKRWLEVGRFPSRKVARLTLDALVAHGHGGEKDFRVKRVTIAG